MRRATAVDYERDMLLKAVGYVLLSWSLLERAVIGEIRRLRLVDGDSGATTARARGSFNERLAEWRALVSLKSRRNPEAVREVTEIASGAERLCRCRDLVANRFACVEQCETGEWAVVVSDAGVGAPRAGQTLLTLQQLSEWNQQMLDACRRIEQLSHPPAS